MSNREYLIRLMYDMRQGGSTIEETAEAVLEFIESNYIKAVAYKIPLRTYLIEGLRVLDRAQKPLTIQHICVGSGNFAIRSHMGQFKHWRLIETHGDLYSLTDRGRGFLQGREAIEEYIWTRNGKRIAPPVGKRDGSLKYIHEFPQDSPKDYDEPFGHLQSSVP